MIGIESELPLVDGAGVAAGREAVTAVFQALVAGYGFQPYHDAHTGALVGVRRDEPGGRLDVGTDFGFCTLEVAFPPEADVAGAESSWNGFLDRVLLPTLEGEGLAVLGYGCQPKTVASGRSFVADKGHYELWTSRMELCPDRRAIDPWPSYAAVQFNLDVPLEDVVRVTNALILLSPLICAWSANSPVFGGEVQPWLELRAKGYLSLAQGHPFFAGRLWFPARLFPSLAEYFTAAWELPIFEVVREGRVLAPVDPRLTTLAFAAGGQAPFVDLSGNRVELSCTTADLGLALVFSWPAVRVKAGLDVDRSVAEILASVSTGRAEDVLADGGRGTFVEVRHLPAMGRSETFAWLTMLLGWLADPDGCAALVGGWRLDEVEACFEKVLTVGWAAEIADRPLPDWGRDALDVAARALPDLGPRLELLRCRLEHRTSPATEALATFRSDGLDALVQQLRL